MKQNQIRGPIVNNFLSGNENLIWKQIYISEAWVRVPWNIVGMFVDPFIIFCVKRATSNLYIWEFLKFRYSNTGQVYKLLFFSQASEQAGFLNPRIWLAKHVLVTGPAFYDTAHGPDNAAPKFRSWKLAVIVNLLPVLLFHRRKVNAALSLFTLKWQGKSL